MSGEGSIAYPFRDFTAALKEKDLPLYERLCHLSPGVFWREWKDVHPEGFPQGGMSAAHRSSIVPKQQPRSG